MTVQDPYPETLAEVDNAALGFAEPDPTVKALNRIATALEQVALNLMDKPVHIVQNGPHAPLASLPPVNPQIAAAGGACPIHGVPWKVVPAGISQRTGNAYEAFRACPTKGCDQRPPR